MRLNRREQMMWIPIRHSLRGDLDKLNISQMDFFQKLGATVTLLGSLALPLNVMLGDKIS